MQKIKYDINQYVLKSNIFVLINVTLSKFKKQFLGFGSTFEKVKKMTLELILPTKESSYKISA